MSGQRIHKEPYSLWPTQGNTTTRDHVAHRVDAVDLKNQLGYVETNRRDRLHVDCSRRHRQLGSRRACVPSAPSVSSLHHHPNRGPKESPSMVSLHLHAFTQSPTADRTEKLLVKSSFFLQPSWAPRKRPRLRASKWDQFPLIRRNSTF